MSTGRENATCPVSGAKVTRGSTAWTAKQAMDNDPDIVQERRLALEHSLAELEETKVLHVRDKELCEFVQLNVVNRAHTANTETRRLVSSVGGVAVLERFTNCFYAKVFTDQHIDKFIASHDDPHGSRFASWIAEKFGDGKPWTQERRTREPHTLLIGNRVVDVAYDRSSAHFAAWHSPKREPEKWGDHFKLHDARIWMRIHFWAAREVGMFENPEFMDYYVRFIGHFIGIYASNSPIFTRESARWSANPRNIRKYIESGCLMLDVIDKPLEVAILKLPQDERHYTGSGHRSPDWPYDVPSFDAWKKCTA